MSSSNPKTKAPFGSWSSPISPNLITQSSVTFIEAKSSGNNLYFIEMRPQEKGRYVLKKYNGREVVEVESCKGVNVRSRVHEYGGDNWIVLASDDAADTEQVLYSDFETQSLKLDSQLIEDGNVEEKRYANGVFDKVNNSFVCICEDHSVVSSGASKEPKNSIVEWRRPTGNDSNKWTRVTIAEGHNFFSSPAVSQDGQYVAFVAWDHPNMPWDATMLYEYNRKTGEKTVVAADGQESIMFPKYSPNGTLYFISDRSDGFWNLHRYNRSAQQQVECIWKKDAEFTSPGWRLGYHSYVILDDDTIVCVHGSKSGAQLCKYKISTGEATNLNSPFRSISHVSLSEDQSKLFFIGGHPASPTALVQYDFASQKYHTIKSETELDIDKSFFSIPQSVEFESTHGTSYGNYYPPTNPNFEGPEGEKPIVLVKIHGGPTSQASTRFNLKYQFWTSRGIAIMDVDYAGSTGHGREYRRKLYRNWGVYDVDDCCAAVKYLAENGLANPKAAVIDGGSAGGATTLSCLAFRDVFAAGCSLYGVADLELLAAHTHKFESRYLDNLIGRYPEEKEIYVKRSPIHSIDTIKAPLLLLQGSEDKIVPPEQAILMHKTMKEKGAVVALKVFEGEQHGFRGSEAIIQSLEMELYFFSKVLGFTPAEKLHTVTIDNLKE